MSMRAGILAYKENQRQNNTLSLYSGYSIFYKTKRPSNRQPTITKWIKPDATEVDSLLLLQKIH